MSNRRWRGTSGAAKTVLMVFVAILGIAAVAVVSVYLVAANNVRKNLDREIASLRAKGQPVGYSDLDEFYDLGPDAATRGYAYTEVIAKAPQVAEGVLFFGEMPDIEEDIGADLLANSRSLRDAYQPVLQELYTLAQDATAVRFPGDTKTWMEVEMPHLIALRSSVRLLCLDALLAGIDGKGDQAIRSISAAITIAESIRYEPLAISQLVRLACLDTAFRTIEQIVNRSKVSDLQLIRFQGALNQVQPEGLTAQAIVGERSLGFVDSPVDETWTTLPPEISPPGLLLRFPAYHQLEKTNLSHTYEELAAIAQMDYFERVQAVKEFDTSLAGLPDFGHRVSKKNGQMLVNLYPAESRSIALRDAAQVGLAALRFHSASNSTRESAAELVPAFLKEVPIDPFSGEPIQLRGKGRGFVAYSAGPDGDDDGGETPSEMGNINRDGDVTFRVLVLPEK